MGRVTVVMATRNRRESALTACRHLTGLRNALPVVVVDNASTDGTADAVERAFPDVQVVRLDRNRGALARTVGVEAARTPYVAFADDDSWWADGALERAAGHLEAHPRLALLAARILVSPTEELDPVCEEMARSPLPRSDDLPGPSVLGFVACGAVVRRSAYLQVGGFHPLIFFGGEETVLAYDLAAAGWGLAYVDDVVAHHHPQPEGDRHGRQRLLTTNALVSSLLRRPLSVPLREAARVLRHATDRQERAGVLDAVRRLGPAMAQRTFLPEHVESQARLLASSRG